MTDLTDLTDPMQLTPLKNVARRPLAVCALTLIVALAACGGGSPAVGAPPTPATATPTSAAGTELPRTDIVQRTTFDPSLGVHLDQMVRRASGLYVQDLAVGKGAIALTDESVVVRYVGWLPNGKQFDAGEITVKIGSNSTIRAWEEGLLGMRVGGRRRLVVPPAMGYGGAGAGEIPPNAVLVFEMEMESVL
jgi:peptidylprolyl isomerase